MLVDSVKVKAAILILAHDRPAHLARLVISIVKNSPFSAKITHDFETARHLDAFFALNEHGCHYVDWTSEGVLLPKVLDEADLDRLLNSQAHFARKFRERYLIWSCSEKDVVRPSVARALV